MIPSYELFSEAADEGVRIMAFRLGHTEQVLSVALRDNQMMPFRDGVDVLVRPHGTIFRDSQVFALPAEFAVFVMLER